MSEELKRRIREQGRNDRRDASFADRLLDLTERIEQEFDGDRRARLLALATDALDRHIELRTGTRRARDVLAGLREDQRRLLELCELLAARPTNGTLH